MAVIELTAPFIMSFIRPSGIRTTTDILFRLLNKNKTCQSMTLKKNIYGYVGMRMRKHIISITNSQ